MPRKARVNLPTKIFLIASLNLLLIGVALGIFVRAQYRFDLQSFLISPAHDRILSVGRQIALELRDSDSAGWNQLLARYAQTNKVDLRLTDDDGLQVAGSTDSLPESVSNNLTRQLHDHNQDSPLLFLGTTKKPTRHWVAVRIPIPSQGGRHHLHGALVAASSSLIGTPFFFDPKPWLAVAFAVVFISFLCWLPFVRRLTRSVSYINQATGQIAEGQFKIQLPVTRRDELGQLSVSINRMANRLNGYVLGQKRFLGDTAHELCSPIARMQVASGILERSSDSSIQEIVSDLRDDLQQLSTLVNDVLSYSKAGLRAPEAKLANICLSDLVNRIVQRECVSSVEISVHIPQLIGVRADCDLLERALSNVVRNAVRYAGGAGPIEISAKVRDDLVSIIVSDCGPGIPEQDLNSIFDPFYRPEYARDRNSGGVGLGLAIVKSCIEACEGTVACRNRPQKGFEVEVSLKTAAPSDQQSPRQVSVSG